MEATVQYLMVYYPMLIGAFFLGGGVGALTGIFGAGGGFIVTPVLNIFLGLPMNMAVGTSSFQVMGASFFSLCRHLDRRFLGVRVASCMAFGIVPGVFLGARLVGWLTDLPVITVNGRELAAVNLILSLIFAVFLLLIAGWFFYDNFLLRHDVDRQQERRMGLLVRVRIPPMITFRTIPFGEFSIVVLLLLGVLMGFLAGLLGIGGGVVMIPVLYYLVGQDTKNAARTGTMLVFLAGLFSTISHGMKGNIDYILSLFLIAGAFFGTKIGVIIHKRISDHSLRKYYTFVVLAAAIMVVVNLAIKIFC